jgi:hypothetical protein
MMRRFADRLAELERLEAMSVADALLDRFAAILPRVDYARALVAVAGRCPLPPDLHSCIMGDAEAVTLHARLVALGGESVL